MKSIGVFWRSFNDEDDYCLNCPHGKDKLFSEKRETSSQDEHFEFQINLWNSDVRNVAANNMYKFRAIDFGIVCPLSTRKLVFLFPFKVEKTDIKDLVKCLSLDTDLLCSVFNEDLKSTSEPAKSYHKIDGESIKYLMYEISQENIESLKYDDVEDVTEMTLAINSNFNIDKFKGYQLFIRYRIKLKSFVPFAKKKKISNDWLQSAFSSTYMFDLRLNDVRELSKKKKELVEFKGFRLPVFRKIHFFYIADSEETVENGSSMKLDKRLLENEIWHSYLGDNLEFVSENIAHHWKSKMTKSLGIKKIEASNTENTTVGFNLDEKFVDNFTLFFKTEFSDFQFRRLFIYVLIAIALGTLASSIVSLIECFMPCEFAYRWAIWSAIVVVMFVSMFIVLNKRTNK